MSAKGAKDTAIKTIMVVTVTTRRMLANTRAREKEGREEDLDTAGLAVVVVVVVVVIIIIVVVVVVVVVMRATTANEA